MTAVLLGVDVDDVADGDDRLTVGACLRVGGRRPLVAIGRMAGIVGEVAAAQGRAVGVRYRLSPGTPDRVSNNRKGESATASPPSV